MNPQSSDRDVYIVFSVTLGVIFWYRGQQLSDPASLPGVGERSNTKSVKYCYFFVPFKVPLTTIYIANHQHLLINVFSDLKIMQLHIFFM